MDRDVSAVAWSGTAIHSGEAALSDRAYIERTIREAYAGRLANDLARSLAAFAEHASFHLVGGAGDSMADAPVSGSAALREAVKNLIDSFEFLSQEVLSFIIDGEQAGVHTRVELRFRPN